MFRSCNDFSQCEHSFACDPAGAIFRPAQDAVFRLCNDFSQCGHRPACDPAGTVFRLCPRRLCLGIVTTSRSANTASPATLPEQLSVLLTTLCFGYVATSRSAGADPPATPPGQFTVLPKTTALKRCSGFSQGRAHVRQRPCRSSLTSCSGRPSHIPPPHPTHPPHPLGVGQTHRRCAHPRVCAVDLYFLTG